MIKKYKVLNPIAYSGRVERGEVIDMEESVAKAFGTEYVVEYNEESVTSTDVEGKVEKDPNTMSVKELREYASELGIDTDGSKADLIERIQLHKSTDVEGKVEGE